MVHVIDLTEPGDPVTAMTAAFLDTVGRPERDDRPFGIYHVAADSEFAPLARLVEREVFDAYFDNDAAVMDAEYGPYEENSSFVLAIDHVALEPVGVIRRVFPGPPGSKTLRDLEEAPEWAVSEADIAVSHPGFRADRCVDLATLAVRAKWSKSKTSVRVAAALQHSSFRADTTLPIDYVIAALDEIVASMVIACEVPLVPICDLPAIEYLGSPATRPYLFSVDHASDVARTAGPLGRMMAYAEGLDEFSFPPIDLRDDATPATLPDLEPQGRRIGTGVPADQRMTWSPSRPAPVEG
ncbi:MAG: hypothetical protein AAF081_12210 [Actinomycetota bacterium]